MTTYTSNSVGLAGDNGAGSANTLNVKSNLDRLIDPLFIGFDRFFENYSSINTNSYPPYNVIKIDDTNYLIEIAVAGFGKNDIEITEQEGVLKIVGSHVDEHQMSKYLHRGIATRRFTRMFNLHDDVKVKSADIHKGMLQISLERIIPEEKKPKRIAIGS
jgi:molecular chaperone IbpA